jgi:diaminopimelate decarboxylase/aspartate kinase
MSRILSVTDQWLVLKFGGSSVSGKKQWQAIESVARNRLNQGYRVLLVCSAIKGITNALQELADKASSRDFSMIAKILLRHRQLSVKLDFDIEDLLAQTAKQMTTIVENIADAENDIGRYSAVASLLAIGEWLSTHIGERYLARKLEIEWVDAKTALQATAEDPLHVRRTWLAARCGGGADSALQKQWQLKPRLLITQGFVAAHPQGGTVLLGRGGSDTSAVLLASRLAAPHVEIWTDVPGLYSADPRQIRSARLLQSLDYDEALEMAASGAKVVHSRCIRAAAEARIQVRIGHLGHGSSTGTTIKDHGKDLAQRKEGLRCVCCQPKMAVLLLQNLDMREQIGFLAWVFSQISKVGISVELVATSETTTTIALNMISNHLDEVILTDLADNLRRRCSVTLFPRCSAINLVGRGARVALAKIDPESAFFAKHPLLMLSQSANDLCISLLVHERHAPELLESLHHSLIGDDLEE